MLNIKSITYVEIKENSFTTVKRKKERQMPISTQ